MTSPPTPEALLPAGVPRRAALLAGLLLLPVPGIWGMRSSLRTGGADPSFYLGLVMDYPALAERFGQTYHGNRISYVLVDRAFFSVLGPVPGFHAARYLVLAAGVLAAYVIGARLGGRASGVLVAGLVALTPWLPRQLLWTHYDGFATVYLLVGTALLAVPRRPRRRAVAEVLAGISFALAVNANLILLAVVAATGLGWWALRWERGRPGGLVVPTLRLGCGFLLGSGVVALVLRVLFPEGEAFPELVALRVGLSVLGDDTWFAPLRGMGRSLFALLPVPAVGIALLVRLARHRGDDDPDRGQVRMAAWTVLGVLALAAVLHFAFLSTWFSASYYTIYHLPGVVHGLAAIVGPSLLAAAPRVRWTVVPVVLAAALASLLVAPAPWPLMVVLMTVATTAALALLLLVGAGVPRIGLAVAAAGTLLAPSVSPWVVGPIAPPEEVARADDVEWDVFDHSVALIGFVEDVVGPRERIKFWHTLDGATGDLLTRLNMVYYGTGEGRLHVKGSPGMPVLGEGELIALRDEGPFALVLLAPDRGDLTEALVALRLAGVPGLRERASLSLDGRVLDVELLVLSVGEGTDGPSE